MRATFFGCCARRERPSDSRTDNSSNEIAPPHCPSSPSKATVAHRPTSKVHCSREGVCHVRFGSKASFLTSVAMSALPPKATVRCAAAK